MEDEEYPDWLWGILDEGKGGQAKDREGEAAQGDAFCEFFFLPKISSIFYRYPFPLTYIQI